MKTIITIAILSFFLIGCNRSVPATPTTITKVDTVYVTKKSTAVTCSADTKKGSHCKKRTTHISGKCHLHR